MWATFIILTQNYQEKSYKPGAQKSHKPGAQKSYKPGAQKPNPIITVG